VRCGSIFVGLIRLCSGEEVMLKMGCSWIRNLGWVKIAGVDTEEVSGIRRVRGENHYF
jgi:hypothetical protein